MTTCATIYRVEGDVGPDLYSELEGIDLTGKSLSLTVRLESGGEFSKDAVIDDATAGTFHFVWDAADLVAGQHQIEFVIVDGSSITRLPSRQAMCLVVRPQA